MQVSGLARAGLNVFVVVAVVVVYIIVSAYMNCKTLFFPVRKDFFSLCM